jgi:hypothetical protein
VPLTSHKRACALAAVAALGGAMSAGCSGDPRPAGWSYISPAIMAPNCATASCHGRAAAAAGLDFSDADRGYASLTALYVWIPNPAPAELKTLPCQTTDKGVQVCYEPFRPLVTPYVPAASRLVNVLRARGAERMPPDRPLNEADIRLIEQWILDGARRNEHASADGGAPVEPVDGGGTDGDAGADSAEAGDTSGDGGADALAAEAGDADADGGGG